MRRAGQARFLQQLRHRPSHPLPNFDGRQLERDTERHPQVPRRRRLLADTDPLPPLFRRFRHDGAVRDGQRCRRCFNEGGSPLVNIFVIRLSRVY